MGYWLLDAETLIYGGISLVLAGLFTLIGRIHPSVDRFLAGLLVYWIADAFFFDGPAVPVIAGIAVLALLHTRLKNTLRPMLLIFGLVFLVSNVAVGAHPLLAKTAKVSPAAAPQPAGKGPPIVHIILDGFMSPQAAASMGTLDHAVAEAIADDYLKRGFRVYTAARSVHYRTHVSVSNMLGLDDQSQPADYNVQRVHEDLYHVRDNHWARQLKSLGYRITVIGVDYIDLCTEEIDACFTYRADGDGHIVSRFGIGIPQRTDIALRAIDRRWYHKGATGTVALYREIDKLLIKVGFRSKPIDVSVARIGNALTVLDDELPSRLGEIRPGEAYLAHVLLPHSPYVLNEDCGLEPSSEWVPRRTLDLSDVESYERLSLQMICTHRRTLALIDAILAGPSGKDAVFFIHGDHGARHVRNPDDLDGANLETLTPEVAADMLDPLFVVRAPGVVEPGLDAYPITLQAEFRDLFLQTAK
jgi:hypothetical protein